MPMFFLDKRVEVICDNLKKLMEVQKTSLDDWEYKKGFYLRPEAADAEGGFEPYDSRTMHWYGPDEHYWFKTEFTVPKEYDGKNLWMHVCTQIDEWDDGKNPQFLLFVNGEVVQGMDMNHRDVLITKNAHAGDRYRLDLQAHTGILHTEFNLITNIMEVDEEIKALYYDLLVPLQGLSRMDKESRNCKVLIEAMNDTVNLLDLRNPYSNEFYESLRKASAFAADRIYGELAGHDDIIATCIGHTHIDVAWWWTVAQTREKVVRSFATVLKLMDEFPEYKFMSSQPQLYAFLKERYPELFAKIKERVKEGRWEVEGGMWVEADCNLTAGESLVRQFMHGKRFFKEEFGKDNKILWLPDVFGYSGALPQIMKKCGIDYFMTTKLAWNQFNKVPNDTLIWRGIDGSEVFTHFISTLGVGQPTSNFFTTYNGMLHPDAIMGGWERYQNKDINNDILISYGYGDGGGGPTRTMLETGKRMEKGVQGIPKVRQAFARTYFDELHERVADNRRLDTWEGEFYFEYHRGTYTSMARNKRGNRKSELMLMDLEFMQTLAEKYFGKAYPYEQLDRLWKTVLINQFHDILPGSAIEEVYEVTKKEYAELAANVLEAKKELLGLFADGSADKVTVLNTIGYNRDDVVELDGSIFKNVVNPALKDSEGNIFPVQTEDGSAKAFVAGVPAKGFKEFDVCSADTAKSPFEIYDNRIVTPYYDICFDEFGNMSSFTDLENDRVVSIEGKPMDNFRMFEDKPIYYDNWDIDIFHTEKTWEVTDVLDMEWIQRGPVEAVLSVRKKISNSTIEQRIHFYANERRIDFETHVDWKEHQHVLKVEFPVDIHSDEATFDIQFGNVKRKIHKNTSWDMARFESCAHKWMDFSEGHYGVSLLNDCKYGHSVNNRTVSLTLIKSGIEPNQHADYEDHYFTYSLLPHAGRWDEAGTVMEGYKLNLPMYGVKGGCKLKELSGESFVAVDKKNVVVETVKMAEDGSGVIVRMYESENAKTTAHLAISGGYSKAYSCNLLEENEEELKINDGTVAFTAKPYEIVTIKLVR